MSGRTPGGVSWASPVSGDTACFPEPPRWCVPIPTFPEAGSINNGSSNWPGVLTVTGNVLSLDASVVGSGAIALDGLNDVTLSGADFPDGGFVIDKTDPNTLVTLGSDITASSMTATKGTLDLGGYLLAISSTGVMSVSSQGTIVAYLDGSAAPQIDVNGTVTLDGALQLVVDGGYTPLPGETITLIQNDGADAVVGNFAGLPEGALILVGTEQFEISYGGGTGNDVVLSVGNEPPAVSSGGPYTVVRGGSVQLDATGTTDPDQDPATLTYEWEFDGDGQFDDAAGYEPIFSAAGIDDPTTITIAVRVTDDGGLTSTDSTTITVTDFALLEDPLSPGASMLAVGGTSGDDHIIFHPGGSGDGITIIHNGVTLGTFAPTSRLVAYGQDGDDTITVAPGLTIPAWLYGDAGNDKLKGGTNDDLLFGGLDDDVLVGKSGRDLLVGGMGADRIVGNADDDILIAGFTDFDGVESALGKIMAEWTSARSYAERVNNLHDVNSNGANEDVFLVATGMDATVHDDGASDTLTGSQGIDWFFANLDGGVLDKITDLDDQEFADVLDWILTP